MPTISWVHQAFGEDKPADPFLGMIGAIGAGRIRWAGLVRVSHLLIVLPDFSLLSDLLCFIHMWPPHVLVGKDDIQLIQD